MRITQVADELLELAGLLGDAEIAAEHRETIRRRIRGVADRLRTYDSPFLTVTAAARRYGIDRKDFRRTIDDGQVETFVVCGRERVDIRQFDCEYGPILFQ